MKKFVFLVGVCMVFLGDCLAGYSDEGEWAARRDLYSRLANDSTLLSDSLMNVFWEEMENSGESGFENVRNETDNLYRLSTVSQEQLDNLNEVLRGYRDSLSVLDSLVQRTQDTVYLFSIRLLRKEIAETDSLIQGVHTGLAGLRSNTLAYLETENGLLPNDSVYEANEQTINDLYYNSIGIGRTVFTAAEQESIDEIAFQCPLAGGKGVYLARSLRLFYETNTYYNDELLCVQAGVQYRKKEENILSPLFEIYPNPTDKKIHIKSNTSLFIMEEISLVNIVGQIVLKQFNAESLTEVIVNTDKYPNGVYYLMLKDNTTGKVYSEKFVIHH